MEMKDAARGVIEEFSRAIETSPIKNFVVIYQYDDTYSRTVTTNHDLASAIALLGHLDIAAAHLRQMVAHAELKKSNEPTPPPPPKDGGAKVIQITRDTVN